MKSVSCMQDQKTVGIGLNARLGNIALKMDESYCGLIHSYLSLLVIVFTIITWESSQLFRKKITHSSEKRNSKIKSSCNQ